MHSPWHRPAEADPGICRHEGARPIPQGSSNEAPPPAVERRMDPTFIRSWLQGVHVGYDESQKSAGEVGTQSRASGSSIVEQDTANAPPSVYQGGHDERQLPLPGSRGGSGYNQSGFDVSGNAVHPHVSYETLYDRRPRRRTRPDRYDVKHGVLKHDRRDNRDRPRTTTMANDARRGPRPATEIMSNFSSAAIPADRITMKPSFMPDHEHIPGASHMGDLAFNEMQFLEQDTAGPDPEMMPPGGLLEHYDQLDTRFINAETDVFGTQNPHDDMLIPNTHQSTQHRTGFSPAHETYLHDMHIMPRNWSIRRHVTAPYECTHLYFPTTQ